MSPTPSPCPVEATRRALLEAWTAAADGAAARPLLARAARLATQVTVGTAGPGHLDDLAAAAGELSTLGQPAGRLLAASLAEAGDEWRGHAEASRCAAGVCCRRPPPPCQAACPANLDIPSFIAHIGHHRYREAVQVMVRDNPLPMTCGLVCPAPCEAACLRGQAAGEPLFIRPMKAVASRHALREFGGYGVPERAAPSGRRVAVIGSGPAGLAASYFLAVRGHGVEIFEAQDDAGGMLRYGIPAYRLPPHLLDIELAQIERLGVAIHTARRVTSPGRLRREGGFDAVFVAPGFQRSRLLPLQGVDLPCVGGGIDFLRAVKQGLDPRPGQRVVVVGGGNVAIDVALTAFRQGARQVHLVCLEARHEMPASPGELATALAEGVAVLDGWGPVRVLPEGRIVFQACLRVFDGDGRFAPEFDPARLLSLDADRVLLAVGQALDDECADECDLEVARGLLVADPDTLRTAEPGIFAGGDAVHGPRTVVAAVRAGKQAAASIDAWLHGRPLDPDWHRPQARDRVLPLPVDAHVRSHLDRAHMPELEPAEREHGYRQIELGLTDLQADAEAGRCLRCDMCLGCGLCQLACSEVGAEALRMAPTLSGRLVFRDFERPADRCIGCGACAQVCPTGAIAVDDAHGMRSTVITGTVVRTQPLLACRACGRPFQTAAQRLAVGARLGAAAGEHMAEQLCPACARRRRAGDLSAEQ